MYELTTLNAFIEVAKHKSFSRASEVLHITQPAISKRVAQLEEELGVTLFNRINRTVTLTEAGDKLLIKATDLIHQAQDLRRYASTLSDEISGQLMIGTSHHIGLHRLPPVLQQFRQDFPAVQLNILFNQSEIACQRVEQGITELAIITLPDKTPEMLNPAVIWHDELCVVTSHDHQLAGDKGISLQQLLHHPCVFPDDNTETMQIMQRSIDTMNIKLDVQMRTNNLETLKMLVSAGFGWTLLPQTMVDDSISVLDVDYHFMRKLGYVTHKKRSLSNSAVAFLKQFERIID